MFRDALKEVRYHPGRIFATLLAIAISVGFMAATSVFLQTEKQAISKSFSVTMSSSDVWVTANSEKPIDNALLSKIKAVPNVAAAEGVWQSAFGLTKDDKTQYAQVFAVPGDDFKWNKIIEGSWPDKGLQIAISKSFAEKMNAKVGDKIKGDVGDFTLVGITDEPKSIFLQTAFVPASLFTVMEMPAGAARIKAAQGANVESVNQAVKAALGNEFTVETSKKLQADNIKDLTQGVDALKYLLMSFAGIALLVGMIIIANTFTILVAQRRRQVGLLRAVGASTGQVQRKLLAEAVILGFLGSLLGLLVGAGAAAAASSFTGSLYWGLGFPWRDLLIELGVGILITVIAAVVPSFKATHVMPLEALQPVLSADAAKKVSKIRAIICTVLLVAGIGLAIMSLTTTGNNVLKAMGGAFLITFGVLGGAPLYVALLLRGLGKVFGLFGTTAKLASTNASRNPQRAAATATALMLAIGLIVTLQVGVATARQSLLDNIDKNYPIDLTVTNFGNPEGFTENAKKKIDGLNGIAAKAELAGGQVEGDSGSGMSMMVLATNGDLSKISNKLPTKIEDGVAYQSGVGATTPPLQIKAVDGSIIELKVKELRGGDNNTLLVNEATMKKLVAKPVVQSVWMKLTNRDDFGTSMTALLPLQNEGVNIGGSAIQAYLITQVFNVLLAIASGLLGVAVVIALIGVANTLGLSVIERTRESALLRALGMQRGSLRLMLLFEALMLALVGAVVGIVAGAFFAWLGLNSVFKEAKLNRDELHFTIDPKLTLMLLGIAVVAAALASILPGRKAANATPTEALAVT